MDAAHPDDVGDTTAAVRSATVRFSAAEFALEHALAGLTPADHEHRAALRRIPPRHPDHTTDTTKGVSRAHRLRIDLHHPGAHRSRADRLVLADHWERDPAHRTSRSGPDHNGQGDDPPF